MSIPTPEEHDTQVITLLEMALASAKDNDERRKAYRAAQTVMVDEHRKHQAANAAWFLEQAEISTQTLFTFAR